MPIYEYACDTCNHRFELRQKFSDPPVDTCPACGGTVRKMVSSVAFALKGGGWYGDGYGTKPEAAQTESTGGAGIGESTETTSKDSATKEAAPSADTPAVSASSEPAAKPAAVEKPAPSADKPVP